MEIDTYNGIANSPAMRNAIRCKDFIDWKHIHTIKGGYNHVLILWFKSNFPDGRIEAIRRKLISYNHSRGEIIDTPQIIKFYNCKQLVLS